MHLYVRDKVSSNEEPSKAARATRSEQAAHSSECARLLAVDRSALFRDAVVASSSIACSLEKRAEEARN